MKENGDILDSGLTEQTVNTEMQTELDEIKNGSADSSTYGGYKPDGGKANTGQKKKKGIFKKLLTFILILILIPVFASAAFLLYCAINSAKPSSHFPDGYYAAVNIPSAGIFFKQALYLNSVDSFLTDSENEKLQGILRSLRANPFFKSRQYDILTNASADALFYPDGGSVFILNLGVVNSSFIRMLPLILEIKPRLFDGVEGIEKSTLPYGGSERLCIIYNLKEDYKLYISTYKNLIFISSSRDLLVSCFEKHSPDSKKTVRLPKVNKNNSLNIAADPSYFISKPDSKPGLFFNILQKMIFAEFVKLNLDISYEKLNLSGNVNWESSSQELEQVLKRRSTIPGILSRLPSSTAYLTLINAGSPEFLLENLQTVFTEEVKTAYKKADRGMKNIFRKDLKDLVFSWMGEEMGVFGHDKSNAPVFFVSLKDEKLCRTNFDYIFNSIFVDRDVSAIVDGKRIPRITIPSWISGLLKLFKIDIPEPFYIIENGYLYLSASSESLVMFKNEADSGSLLVKTELWKDMTKTISGETSFFVYYTLERSIPFFLQNNPVLENALKNYGKGILSVKLEKNNNIILEAFTKRTESHVLSEIPSFPKSISKKSTGEIICAKNSSAAPCLFWVDNKGVNCMTLSDGNVSSLAVTGKCSIAADIQKGFLKTLWITTEQGTVYKTDSLLEIADGFPIITGEKLYSAPPAVMKEGIAASLFSQPKLIFVKPDGDFYFSADMVSKLRAAPVCFENKTAAVPRSFESYVYLFDTDGNIEENYPAELSGISSVQPLMFFGSRKNVMLAMLTEDGNFTLHPADSVQEEIFNINLDSVCKAMPVYSKSLDSFFVVSNDGKLFKIDSKGSITETVFLRTENADDYVLTLLDLNADGKDEILISGGGNAIYAFNSRLIPLKGFPVSGIGAPYLIDVDGDGKKELVTCGIDSKIHAFNGGKEW